MAAGTQFIGKEAILAVYSEEYGDQYPWALFQSKKRRAAGIGADELSRWVDRFAPAGSSATYTLCVYDEDVDPEKVGAGTDALACWDFKITAYQGNGGGSGGAMGKLQQMMESDFMARIKAVEDKMNEEPDDKDGIDINKIIMDYLENPHKIGAVIGAVKSFFGGAMGGATAVPQAIGGIPGAAQQTAAAGNQEEQLQRLCNAIDRLQVKYPNLVPCLEKLADIAENDPITWALIKSKLDAL